MAVSRLAAGLAAAVVWLAVMVLAVATGTVVLHLTGSPGWTLLGFFLPALAAPFAGRRAHRRLMRAGRPARPAVSAPPAVPARPATPHVVGHVVVRQGTCGAHRPAVRRR